MGVYIMSVFGCMPWPNNVSHHPPMYRTPILIIYYSVNKDKFSNQFQGSPRVLSNDMPIAMASTWAQQAVLITHIVYYYTYTIGDVSIS